MRRITTLEPGKSLIQLLMTEWNAHGGPGRRM